MGAIGGPCSGHLSLSQVALMEASAVGQLNSLPSISQTWAPSPGWNLCWTVMWEWCGAEQIAENYHKAKYIDNFHQIEFSKASTQNGNFSIFPFWDMVS